MATKTKTPASSRASKPKPTEFYCPGCGTRYPTDKEPCTGGDGLGHPPIDVVPTSELDGPADKHTPAPASDG